MVVETPGYGGALLTTFDEVSPEDSSEISSGGGDILNEMRYILNLVLL